MLRRHPIGRGRIEAIDIVLDDRGARGGDVRKDIMKGIELERVTGSCNREVLCATSAKWTFECICTNQEERIFELIHAN
jgi:hypothetical protein